MIEDKIDMRVYESKTGVIRFKSQPSVPKLEVKKAKKKSSK